MYLAVYKFHGQALAGFPGYAEYQHVVHNIVIGGIIVEIHVVQGGGLEGIVGAVELNVGFGVLGKAGKVIVDLLLDVCKVAGRYVKKKLLMRSAMWPVIVLSLLGVSAYIHSGTG